MIKVNSETIVYVYAPVNKTTGGAELLHQLVHALNIIGVKAYVVYLDNNHNVCEGIVPQPYSKYLVEVSNVISDKKENIVVIYEGIFDKIYSTTNTQLVLWWLSVDNFFICSQPFLSIKDLLNWNFRKGFMQILKRPIKTILGKKRSRTVSIKQLSKLNALHCYQSEYAQNYLSNNDVPEMLALSDFINTDFVNNASNLKREDKVLYNPAKGFKYTQRVMSRCSHLKWVPLVGMTREQLIHEFQTSKLYVDFGYHPGKDRIPREAALNGCCVVTNKAGSAKFFEDVPLYRQYKIDQKSDSLESVKDKIDFILANYNELSDDFSYYRSQILEEESIFHKQVKHIFRKN